MNNQYSPTGFSFLPVVVKNLLIINGIMFLADVVMARLGIELNSIFGLHFFLASDFRPWQLLTYMFMHGNFSHLFFNMFALWMFGNTLENIWGTRRFLIYYLLCGLGAGVLQEGVQYIEYITSLSNYDTVNMGGTIIPMSQYLNYLTTVGASGAIYGLLLAFGMMFPNSMIYLYFLVPIKAKWFVIGYAVIELLNGLGASGDHVAHFAHLGGMLVGLIIILIWKKKGRLY
jgi:membrane associated rhomboid family serine protease